MADALRRDALQREEGELLGSEDELIRRYDVSRPTLRQAAALVSQENLLVVRRGVGGGYFVRRPESSAVAHVAALYLRSRHTRVEEIIRSLAPIRIELAKLAARNPDPLLNARMADFLAHQRARDVLSYGEFLRSERDFGRLLQEMGGNQVLSLFLEILYDCTAMFSREEDVFRNHPERVAEYRGKRNRLAEAIVEGDEELARLAARRCANVIVEWLMQELERRPARAQLFTLPSYSEEAPRARKARA